MKRAALLAVAFMLAAPALQAQTMPMQPGGHKMAPKLMSGDTAAANVHALTSNIHWYESLEQAKAMAQREGKPIVWMHMLGRLDGET